MVIRIRLIFLLLVITGKGFLFAQPFTITESTPSVFISNGAKYLIDKSNTISVEQINSKDLFNSRQGSSTPVFKENIRSVWVRFETLNQSSHEVFLDIPYTNIGSVSLYRLQHDSIVFIETSGNNIPVNKYEPGNPNIVFNLHLPQNVQTVYYLHVESVHPIILPMYLSTRESLVSSSAIKNFFIGFYFGLLMVAFFYNFFLFVSTKDINYFYYILYVFALILAQLCASGYGYFYLWPNSPGVNTLSLLWASYFSGITAFIFSIFFLRIKFYLPKVFPYLLVIFFIYLVGLIASLFDAYSLSYTILNYNSLFNGVLALIISILIIKKGFKTAVFYLIAWASFLVSVIILVLRNLNILPYNNFTASSIYIGSAIEIILLSIALADRINTLKKEKELSQAEALQRATENEKLVNEQNILLEQKVNLRTTELQTTNNQLNSTLANLKDTQTQLVEAEKMASLGQLTAGIAHEINNPINFVKSNITPLRLDVKDLMEVLNAYNELHTLNGDPNKYKQKLESIKELKEDIDLPYVQKEINNLIAGIEEGAERTAEIVRGLRTFSRIDEAALKLVNIHDGLLSTIVLLKNNIPYYVKVVKDFQSQGEIECFPGKLNQVFMNILTNAVQAITSKPNRLEEETLTIKTRDLDDGLIEVSIKDSGMGMTEEVKHRIFEPFFTTKDVGEGTGLGMAIVFKIIQKHNGKINIITAPGEGAEFIITLPNRYQGQEGQD
ncbi:MAG: GHKL domain-containing protein [Bacteroidetes bacterium]|nr:GHKL domain-containing protein [Bacteroidota bacterium]